MRYTISGDSLQFLNVEIDEGESFIASADTMAYMTDSVTMEARVSTIRGIKSVMTGRNEHMAIFKSKKGTGTIGLGGNVPGKILELNLLDKGWIFQLSALIGFENTIQTESVVQKKISSTQFSHSGLILHSLKGRGKAFMSACGDHYMMDLAVGEKYLVSTGNALAWEDSVKFEISMMPGMKTAAFGAESIFITTLTGPGKIVIQSMNPGYLAATVTAFLPK